MEMKGPFSGYWGFAGIAIVMWTIAMVVVMMVVEVRGRGRGTIDFYTTRVQVTGQGNRNGKFESSRLSLLGISGFPLDEDDRYPKSHIGLWRLDKME